jgi:hypothetical protein
VVWVDPVNPQHIIAGPAEGVSRNGRIEESYDGGQAWHLASDGMMSAPYRSIALGTCPSPKAVFPGPAD